MGKWLTNGLPRRDRNVEEIVHGVVLIDDDNGLASLELDLVGELKRGGIASLERGFGAGAE